jgi:3-isopropylmalate/(R)-2-methylmalate dehydratase small subunit
MEPFSKVNGQAAPLLRPNIDTDIIIRIERLTESDQSRLGDYAFEAWRFLPDGREDALFVLNEDRFRNAPILLAGANFGCGSSREGAVTALMGRGIKAVIAPSFGDIFYGNCFQNGLLPVTLPEKDIEALAAEVAAGADAVTVDLQEQVVVTPRGTRLAFSIDPLRRQAMLSGLDDIGQTLLLRDEIRAWQKEDRHARPWVWQADRATAAAATA